MFTFLVESRGGLQRLLRKAGWSRSAPRYLILIRDLLELCRSRLLAGETFDHSQVETELEARLRITGSQTFDMVLIDLFENEPRYKFVAASFMQHANRNSAGSRFQAQLAVLYRVSTDARLVEGDLAGEFWNRFDSEKARNLRETIDDLRDEWDALEARGAEGGHLAKARREIQRLSRELQELTGEAY